MHLEAQAALTQHPLRLDVLAIAMKRTLNTYVSSMSQVDSMFKVGAISPSLSLVLEIDALAVGHVRIGKTCLS